MPRVEPDPTPFPISIQESATERFSSFMYFEHVRLQGRMFAKNLPAPFYIACQAVVPFVYLQVPFQPSIR